MTQINIINRVENDFGMVPRALWRLELSSQAKLCAAYLFSLRDGAAPYVAQIEAETGLGRDARRKAFAELETLGVVSWRIVRDARKRIVAKTLVVDYLPIIMAGRAPENQSDGEKSHAPENPAGGFSVPAGVENGPTSDGKSGDLLENEKKKTRAARADAKAQRAAAARAAVARPAGGGSVRAVSDSESQDSARPADPWQRAASSAALGLKWLHPESGRWFPASAFAGEWDRASDGPAGCSIAAE